MKPDDFENQLRRTPMREIPTEWRGEILGRMKDESGRMKEKREGSTWWRDLLWPSPVAWGALACIWLGIILSNIDLGNSSQEQPMAAISAEALMVRLAQQRSLSEGRGMF